jgi:hypothetical protein
MKTIQIGVIIEKESRELQNCPSYYAADYEIIKTKVGEYPLYLTFEGGYTVPMPYWLTAGIDGDRIDGALFSGCGGVNYHKTELAKEPVKYTIQQHFYQLREMVKSGRVRLNPKYNYLLEDIPWRHKDAPKTWEDIN